MSAPSVIVSQRCNCGRSKEHLHYSGNHDFLIKAGLLFLLLAEGISFVQGAVKGSTTLYLQNSEIQRYQLAMTKMTELTAPYEYLYWHALGLEVVVNLSSSIASFDQGSEYPCGCYHGCGGYVHLG